LVLIAVLLLPVVVTLQMRIDPQRKQFQPGRGVSSMITEVGSNPVVMPSQFVAGTLIGLREVVAGLLWIRADDFFHTGNYDALIPLTRIITWLDPHQIDVYRVGAWHLAYNLVDSNERADYRFLSPSVKFLEEGIANNPHVSDLEFDLGFVIYDGKVLDFEKSLYWIRKSCQEKDAFYPMVRQIPHELEKCGRIDECIAAWQGCVKVAQDALKKNPNDLRALDHKNVSKHNLDMTLIRKEWRRDLDKHRLDLGFDASFKRLGPRKFQVSGKINLPDGARVDLMLEDADYKDPQLKAFSWNVDPNVTVLADTNIHGLYVEGGKFRRNFDVTKDSKQYPFKKDKYVLILTFNPRTAPAHVQDVTSWSGEGITDKKYLDTSIPGLRRVRKVIPLKRDDLI
jgi:hypothetical protein